MGGEPSVWKPLLQAANKCSLFMVQNVALSLKKKKKNKQKKKEMTIVEAKHKSALHVTLFITNIVNAGIFYAQHHGHLQVLGILNK